MARRLKAMGQANYANGFALTLHEHALALPLTWKKPQVIFVNSMSDLFHEEVPVDFIQRTFEVMRKADWHVFQVLTKRAERLVEVAEKIDWPKNVWMGVSVENQDYLTRVDQLRTTPAAVRFLSLEPLLGAVPGLELTGIDWVIVGGESGPEARPMREEWALEVRDKCLAAAVPFFFKQWGGTNKKKAGKVLAGRTWEQMPRNRRPAAAFG
jgi:protein gp37